MFRSPSPPVAATLIRLTGLLAIVTLSACAPTRGRPNPEGTDAAAAPSAADPAPPGHPTGSAPPPSTRSARPVVVLDPGHNGGNATHTREVTRQVPAGFGQRKACNTVGTQTPDGYPEHAFTFDVANRVRALLTAAGVDVRMTRTDDSGVGPCVNERAAAGNRAGASAVVSIHGDGSVVGHGFHIIEAARAPAGPAVAAASQRLASAVHRAYVAGSGFAESTYVGEHGYDRRSDLAGLNLSTRPTILLECGNMRDPGDARRMRDPAGRQQVAAAIAAGIEDYLRQEGQAVAGSHHVRRPA